LLIFVNYFYRNNSNFNNTVFKRDDDKKVKILKVNKNNDKIFMFSYKAFGKYTSVQKYQNAKLKLEKSEEYSKR